MTWLSWLFLGAWVLTVIVSMGYMAENEYLRKNLDSMIDKMTDQLTDEQAHAVLVDHIKARNPSER